MKLSGKKHLITSKDRTCIKKELLNKNKAKLINLILSKKPISLLSNIKYNNLNISHKVHISEKGYSLKNTCFQKSKVKLVNNINNIKKNQAQDFSNYKTFKNRNKIKKENNTSCNNLKNGLQKNFYITNKNSYEIPNDNISYIKKNKYIIKKQKSESIRKNKKYKSISSISRNLNMTGCSYEERRASNKSLLNNKNNYSFNANNTSNKKYINKIQKNFNKELKHKISLLIKEQRTKSNRKTLKLSNSHKCIKNIKSTEKNNIYGNITTNNSDKEITDFTTKKNNLTTHYCTTNFNNSTNISETTNNEINSEIKILKQKKTIKKKLGLPFHPNSKKVECYNKIETKNNIIIRNNKNEISIPYNKKRNKFYQIQRENSPPNNYCIKKGKNIVYSSARNKNDSFFDLYDNISNNKSNNFNFVDSFDENKSSILNNNNVNISSSNNKEKEDSIGVEIAHFRIVSIIQENKKLLNNKDK